jgi:predicted Zn-dependent peptidase
MFKQLVLKNGLKVLVAPMKSTKTITILLIIGTGSKYEDRKNNGISHFLEHMFFKGTLSRPNSIAISNELDQLGSEYNAFTSKEYTGYWVKVDARYFAKALDILGDMLINSKFDEEEIAREKGVIIEEINMYEDNPMMHIEDVFEDCLYGDTPAGWETIGTKANIHAFRRQDFVSYFEKQYNTKNTFVCLAGDVKGEMLKNLEKNLSGFKRAQNFHEKSRVKVSQTKPQIKLGYKKTDQAHISLGAHAMPYSHPDRLTAKLVAIILGGSMSSRLFINLRERNGLAYYVRTDAEFYTDSGYLTTMAGVPVSQVEKAVKIILSEYKKISSDSVDKVELERTKDLICGRSTIQLESSDNIANWFARQAVMNMTIERTKKNHSQRIFTPEEYFKKIRAIRASDIKRVAKKIFTEKNLNLAVIGPFKEKGKLEKLLKI